MCEISVETGVVSLLHLIHPYIHVAPRYFALHLTVITLRKDVGSCSQTLHPAIPVYFISLCYVIRNMFLAIITL